jgi:hypothetical protein
MQRDLVIRLKQLAAGCGGLLTITLCPVATRFAPAAEPPLPSDQDEFQRRIDNAAPRSVVQCDPNKELRFSSPVIVRKPMTIVGLHARLPEKLGATSLVVVEAKGVALTDFELVGNAETVAQKDRAPLLVLHAGEFRVERGLFINSSKDGVMIDGDGSNDEDLIGGTVRDVVGRGVRRDVVSISGSNGHGRKIRNVLVENVRCYQSAFRGAVEVSDGTDNITVRKVYAEDAVYAIDVQDHHQAGQSNRNVVIEDIFARRCQHAIRTANSRQGHANLTVRDVVAEQCRIPLQIANTENVALTNVRIIDHDGDKAPMQIQNCQGLAIRDLLLENIGSKGPGLLLQNCNDALIDGVVLRGEKNQVSSAICFRLRGNGTFAGLRISNVHAHAVTDAGIVLELHDAKEGTLRDYVIRGNAATVRDTIRGEGAIVSDNLEDGP